jgi:carbonic anhydrase
VAFQVERVCASAPVLRAWEEGRPLAVHGLLYRLHDGLLQDLGLTREGPLG